MFVRGPSISKSKKVEEVALSIDLAPTFIDLAGGVIPKQMDGVSLKKVLFESTNSNSLTFFLKHNKAWRKDFLVEYVGERGDASGVVECGLHQA